MRTVNIRDIRGATLREYVDANEMVGLKDHRQLVAVLIPVSQRWVEHLIETNFTRVQQSVQFGEAELDDGSPLVSLDELVSARAESATLPDDMDVQKASARVIDLPRVAAAVSEAVERLLPSAVQRAAPEPRPAVRTVRIGAISAGLIAEAAAASTTLAVTHDRELLGILMPVSTALVEQLIELNMTRVLFNIAVGEQWEGGRARPLDEVAEQARELAAEAADAAEVAEVRLGLERTPHQAPRRRVPHTTPFSGLLGVGDQDGAGLDGGQGEGR